MVDPLKTLKRDERDVKKKTCKNKIDCNGRPKVEGMRKGKQMLKDKKSTFARKDMEKETTVDEWKDGWIDG